MKILLVKDLMRILRASRPTVYRWLAERRMGIGTFPLPISQAGRQLRWNADDIEQFCQSQSNVRLPIAIANSKQRREKKAFQDRQEAAAAVLEKHGILINNSTKRGGE